MKNIIKYLGCLALGLLILNKVDFSVYAAEPSKVVRHVEYDEITDVNQLLQMGIEEYQKTPKVRNQSENEEITVKQLLSITEYDDGTIEKSTVLQVWAWLISPVKMCLQLKSRGQILR